MSNKKLIISGLVLILVFRKTGNEEFITQLSQWTFQEKSVLKVVGHSHHKQNETEQPDWYRVKDEIVSKIKRAEFDSVYLSPKKKKRFMMLILLNTKMMNGSPITLTTFNSK